MLQLQVKAETLTGARDRKIALSFWLSAATAKIFSHSFKIFQKIGCSATELTPLGTIFINHHYFAHFDAEFS